MNDVNHETRSEVGQRAAVEMSPWEFLGKIEEVSTDFRYHAHGTVHADDCVIETVTSVSWHRRMQEREREMDEWYNCRRRVVDPYI